MEAKKLNITIEGTEYFAQQGISTLMKYQSETGKNPMLFDTLEDEFKYLHCSLKVNNDNYHYSFDQFLRVVDHRFDMLEIVKEFTQISIDEMFDEEQPKVEDLKKKS